MKQQNSDNKMTTANTATEEMRPQHMMMRASEDHMRDGECRKASALEAPLSCATNTNSISDPNDRSCDVLLLGKSEESESNNSGNDGNGGDSGEGVNNSTSSDSTSRAVRASLADALSSSLANIATVEGGNARLSTSSSSTSDEQKEQHHHHHYHHHHHHHHNSGSEERNGSSGSGGGPAVVTATTNTSSGDDRYSSGNTGNNSGGGSNNEKDNSNNNNNTNNNNNSNVASALQSGDRGVGGGVGGEIHHHHYPHHQRRQQLRAPQQLTDEYGLPSVAHADLAADTRRHHSGAHTVVVARLPPPQTQTSSSSFFSSSSGEEREGGVAGRSRRSGGKTSSVATAGSRMPTGMLSMLSSTANPLGSASGLLPTKQGKSSSNSNKKSKQSEASDSLKGLDTSSSIRRNNKGSVLAIDKKAIKKASSMAGTKDDVKVEGRTKQPTSSPTTATKKIITRRRNKSATADDTGSLSTDGSSADSGSGTEGGYAGSASSNFENFQQSSCSSPSVSSSEGDGGGDGGGSIVTHHKKRELTTPYHHHHHHHTEPGGGELQQEKVKTKNNSNHHHHHHHHMNGNRQLPSSLEAFSSDDVPERTGAQQRNISSGSCSPVSSSVSSSSSNGESDEQEQQNGRSRALAAGVSVALNSHLQQQTKNKDNATTKEESSLLRKTKRPRRESSHHHHQSHDDNSNNRKLSSTTSILRPFESSSKMERAAGRRSQQVCCDNSKRSSAGGTKHHYQQSLEHLPRKRPRRAMLKTPPAAPEELMLDGKPPIFSLGCDLMATCMSYLDPIETYSVLTMPLSTEWYAVFTEPQELWSVLCLLEPFKATFDEVGDDADSSGDESLCSFPIVSGQPHTKHMFGRYRLLYTSFIRCMKYLARIKDDAIHGRPPSVIDYGRGNLSSHRFKSNSCLKNFLANARGVINKNKRSRNDDDDANGGESSSLSSGSNSRACSPVAHAAANRMNDEPVGVSDEDLSSVQKNPSPSRSSSNKKPASRLKFASSSLTQRLLGPAPNGQVANVDLPPSCAVYSIVNWMVAFSDVEGIQTMCLRVLPYLLEDETQRTTAQRAGLTNTVLRCMVQFPDSIQLHTAAFHTIVLLARPLGGREGMLFHSSMVNSSDIFNNGSGSGKNGIAVMLDSMRRFEKEEALQAMSCWSLVNIALAPSQKTVLVKLGGIEATANAMMQHPYSAEVQFRALFSLINLVIPSVSLSEDTTTRTMQNELGEVNDTTEKEMLDENVEQIANLVVLAMKNFCSSQTILNRACLVLHNLSLTQEYHSTLLWAPNCYQMLEWCMANYPSDQVLQQSAQGTLHRLQMTLASDEVLRNSFTASIHAQQQLSLEQAHREATLLHDQQEQQRREAAEQLQRDQEQRAEASLGAQQQN